MRVERLSQVVAALKKKLTTIGNPKPSVIVGYRGVKYAIFVHENLQAAHTVGKAHFLTDPAKRLGKSLGKQIAANVRKGMTFGDAVYLAGLRIQRESQLEVPVDTGNLKGSAFTEKETTN